MSKKDLSLPMVATMSQQIEGWAEIVLTLGVKPKYDFKFRLSNLYIAAKAFNRFVEQDKILADEIYKHSVDISESILTLASFNKEQMQRVTDLITQIENEK